MGQKTSQITQSANPFAASAYQSLIPQIEQIASTPYQPYTGQGVAPINAQQKTGIAGINANANFASPSINTALGYLQESANPLTSGQINQYYSPYNQDVINATEAQFANSNAQQREGLNSNLAAQGALGGSGAQRANALLAGQQQLAQAPTIAGLENTGYNQAVQLAMNQFQQNPQAAAYGLANTGIAGQNAGLTGAQAQIGAGTLEQQTAQQQDVFNYQQYLQQLAYPFQTAGWEAGNVGSLGSLLGGQTTYPGPSLISQLGGLGVAGLGLGKLLSNRGGRIQGLAMGGVPYGGDNSFLSASGYVPQAQGSRAQFKAPPANWQPETAQQMFSNAANMVKGIGGVGGASGLGNSSVADTTNDALQDFRMDTLGLGSARGGMVRKRGGYVRAGMGLSSFVPRLADGGTPDDAIVIPDTKADRLDAGLAPQAFNDRFGAATAQPMLSYSGLQRGSEGAFGGDPSVPDQSAIAGIGTEQADVPMPQPRPGLETWDVSGDVTPLDRFASGIAHVETGGERNPYHSVVSTGTGHQVYGKYQIYDTNIPTWTQQALGRPLTPEQFLADPHAQEATARYKLGEYIQKYGYAGAARAWLAGEGGMNNATARDRFGSDPYGYAAKVMAHANLDDSNANTTEGVPQGLMASADQGQSDRTAGRGLWHPDSTDLGAGMERAANRKANSSDIWQSVLAAGLGMMASKSPFALSAIGEGGLAGLGQYGALQKQHLTQAHEQAQVDQGVERLKLLSKQLQNTERHQTAQEHMAEQQFERQLNAPKVMTPGQQLVNPITGKVIATNESGSMTDQAVDLAVDRIRAGDPRALQNLGRGAQSGVNLTRIQNRLAERAAAENWTGADIAAAQANFSSQAAAAKTAAVREANVQSAVEEAKNTFPLVLQRSRELPRTSFVPLNKLEQIVREGTSSPEQARYNTALQGAMTAYSQAMSRTGTNSVYAQQHAHDLLNAASGPEAIEATIGQMQQEMDAAVVAPEVVRKAILGRISGKGEAAPSTMEEAAKAREGAPSKPTPTDKDRNYVKAHPEVRQKFIEKFGVEP